MKTHILFISVFIFISNFNSADAKYFEFEPLLVSENENIFLSHICQSTNGDIYTAGEEQFYDEKGNIKFSNQIIFKSTDNANSWQIVMRDTNENLSEDDRLEASILSIKCISNDVIVALCTNGYIRVSKDGGKSWKLLQELAVTYRDFNSKNEESWLSIFRKSTYNGNGTSKIDYYLMQTTNSGESWEEISIPFDTLFPESENHFFLALTLGKDNSLNLMAGYIDRLTDSTVNSFKYILKSTDNGNSWEKIFLYEDKQLIYDLKTYKYYNESLKFVNNDNGFWLASKPSQTKEDLVGRPFFHPIVQYTNDGGYSWETIFYDTSSRATFSDVIVEDNGNFLFYSHPGGIYRYEKSNDDFYSILPNDFKLLSEKYSLRGMFDFIQFDESRILVAAAGNYLFLTDLSEPVSVEIEDIKIKTKVYPNPANDLVKIEISTIESINIYKSNISVYDVKGNRVKDNNIKVDLQNSLPGSLTWNCSGLPDGVYFIVISDGQMRIPVRVVKSSDR